MKRRTKRRPPYACIHVSFFVFLCLSLSLSLSICVSLSLSPFPLTVWLSICLSLFLSVSLTFCHTSIKFLLHWWWQFVRTLLIGFTIYTHVPFPYCTSVHQKMIGRKDSLSYASTHMHWKGTARHMLYVYASDREIDRQTERGKGQRDKDTERERERNRQRKTHMLA